MSSSVLQGRYSRFVMRVAVLVAAITAFALPLGSAMAATNFTVSTTSDTSAGGGACGNSAIKTPPSPLSLREATCLANNVGGEVNITVPAGEYKLANGELIPAIAIGQTVNYIGAGAASTIVNAQGLNRVVNYDSTVVGGIAGKMSGLTITGGSDNTFGGAGIIAGSGNHEAGDELTLESVVVKGNEANPGNPTVTNKPGGGVQMANGKLVVINCTFTENKSNGSKGSALAIINQTGNKEPEGLRIVGSTFSKNEAANGYVKAAFFSNGGAVYISLGAATAEITESRFIGNEVNSTTQGGAEGAAIFQDKKAPTTITRSIFNENKVSNTGGGPAEHSAITSTNLESSITLHYNRFHGNNTSTAVGGTGTWNATDNWWGCNTGANTTGCDGADAAIATTPYLKLNGSASPTTLAGPNATSTLQGDFLHDSAGTAISEANLVAFAGEPLTWSDPKPAGATINGHASPETTTTNIASGKATATYNSQSTSGAGHAVVAFDNASVTIGLTVDQKPAITQNPSNQSVSPGATASFTAAASGTPSPTVQWQRNTGSGFTNIAGATSTTYSFTTTSTSETGYEFRAVFSNTIEGTTYTATTTAATLTVSKAVTALSTSATSNNAGKPIKDTATLSGGKSPTGTITFKVYGPNDSTCSGAVASTSSKTVTANGSYESAEFTPSAIGAYRWVVEYSGDSNNEASTSGCNASNETSTVTKFVTSLSSTATGSTYPGKIKDTATLSGGSSPTGTVTFKAYGPNDATCTGAVAYTKSQTVTGNGSYGSEEFTPTGAGAYRWTIEYSGDTTNEAATSGCNASNETSTVAKAVAALSTQATNGQAGTTAIHDTATLSGGSAATGSITFKAFAPGDTSCTGTPAYTKSVTVSGNGSYGSESFTPAKAGSYRWTAVYSGDTNNETATSACNASEETSTVTKATSSLSTQATNGTAGTTAIHDTATLSGGASPTGTVTFKAYGPNDATCANAAAFTSTKTVSGNGAYESAGYNAGQAGAYRWVVEYTGDANNEAATSACNTSEETSTVAKASPGLTTEATSATVGSPVHDTATLASGSTPTGTITFKAYGPNDATCTGTTAFTDTETVSGNGAVESEPFTPTEAGAYRWTAEYSGDTNNETATSGCNAANEKSTAAQATPSLSTEASNATAGGSIHDTATLSGGVGPTGSITFKAYGPGDTTCTGTPVSTSSKTVSGNGSYESDSAPVSEAGAYRWTAEYSGDSNNEGATSGCNAAEETSTVAKAGPSLSTEATDGQAATTAIHDTATLSGGVNATGTITFKAYGPNDATCSTTAAFTDTEPVSGNGAVESEPFTATEAGAYRWTAEYSGDGNNETATSGCNAAEETSSVAKAAPAISTEATDNSAGQPIKDTATLSGGSAPTGTITFKVYGPNDATCSTTAAFTDTEPVSGNGAVESAGYSPAQSGAYRWTAEYSGDANNEIATSGCNASEETSTVSNASPGLTTEATSATVGSPVHDTATLASGSAPTGSITFKAYGPNDATCTGSPAFTDNQPVSGNGTYPSGNFTPTEAGTYRWTAEYSGDANNEVATSACNASEETSNAAKAAPAISTEASDAVAGGSIHDSATLSGGVGTTGTITFKAYGPGDTTCTGTPVSTSSKTVSGNGNYESDSAPVNEAGTYRWTAEYSGDSNNEGATSGCNAAEETSTVAQASPALSTEATDGQAATTAIHDTATLSGGVGATGTITFNAYGPEDATCSNAAAFTDTEPVTGNGAVESEPFTAGKAGTYRWTAEYSGDANNEGASSGCNASEETSTVTKAAPTISTVATNAVLGSGSIHDTATLSSGSTPTGTITFKVYGPNDLTCSNAAAFTDNQTVSGNGSYPSGNFTPSAAGSYRWTAEYSGDVNNESASSGCNASIEETSTVAVASPSISTEATDAEIGSAIEDTATLSGGQIPTGTITFKVYGPDDATCSGAVAYTKTQTVAGNGSYESEEFTPTTAGTYRWTADYSGDLNNASASSGCNAAEETSAVAQATPSISTLAGDGKAATTPIEDTATLASGHSPTGTITFKAYSPGNTTCSGTAAYTKSQTVTGNGDYESEEFIPPAAGAYRWTVQYSGDVNNEAATSGCNSANETSNAAKASPGLSTNATGGNAGAPIHDSATISAAASPTGTITFKVYGPEDATCSNAAAFTSTKTVSGSGAESAPFTPTKVGSYRWTAEYSGDTNNEAASSGCNASGETSAVGKATPALATKATDAAFGAAVHDSATLSGGVAATGTLTFKAYGPDDTSCSGLPVFSATATVSGDGVYSSGDFAPTQSGTYRWVTTYSGDANNQGVSGLCGAEGETSVVSAPPSPPAPPAISPCPATTPSVAPYEPPKKTVNGPVPGVRARISVARPSQLSVTATLKYRRGGKTHSVDLGTAALYDGGVANLKLALPPKLAQSLPVGTKVHLTLAIAAYPAGTQSCSAQPEPSTQHLRTKVVRVLVD